MKKRMVMVIMLASAIGNIATAASEGASKKRSHKKRSAPVAASSSGEGSSSVTSAATSRREDEPSWGDILLNAVYNNGHHRVLFLSPDGRKTFIFPGEACKVAALFTMMERNDRNKRKDLDMISVADMESKYCIMDKGDHSYLLRYTPDGLAVHRIRDSKTLTRGRILLPVYKKATTWDLAVVHDVSISKTKAFSAHEPGVLAKRMPAKDAKSKSGMSAHILTSLEGM